MKFFQRSLLLARNCLAVVLVALTVAFTPALAEELHYLPVGQPDAARLLPPPPLLDSAEQAADMDQVKAIYHSASSNDIAAAYSEKDFTVFNFTCAVGSFFQSNNLPKTTVFFEKVQLDADTATGLAKKYFKRPRPYTADPSLANGKLEKSFSYPSGHSTESMVLALVLADLLPEKHDAIIAHARQMGWHRVQIARHYSTDIYAGRMLAQEVVRKMKQNPDFQKDFAEAKSEITAAQK
ncbi:MAG: phosphatase PAP2 family protein [Limisphaerales bacterium]